jgi:hypothetical protein
LDFALCATRPQAQVANSRGQCVEGLRAFPAEEMHALVLVGSPDFVTHWQKMARNGTGRNLDLAKAVQSRCNSFSAACDI